MVKKITIIFLLISGIIFSQERIFESHDIFKIKTVNETVISPSGKYVAFSVIVQRPIEESHGAAYRELYLYKYERNEIVPLLTGQVSISNLGWTTNSKFISFTARLNGDKSSQIYLISIDAADTVKITDSKTSVLQYAWHPIEDKVAFIANEHKPIEKHIEMGFDLEIFEENIPGRILHLLNRENSEIVKLNDEGAVFDFKWSPDGKSIAAAIAPQNLVDDSYMFKQLYIIDINTKKIERLVDNQGKLGNFSWNSNGSALAFISGADKNDAVDGSLFVVSVPNIKMFTELVNYSKEFVGSVTDVHWDGNETVLYVSEEGVYTTLRKQKVGSAKSEILIKQGESVFNSISISKNKIVFTGNTPQHPSELFTYYTDKNKIERNTFHNEWLNEIRLAKQEVIEYKASDGLNIEGLLFYPVNYQAGEKYPMIIYAHGGPEATNSFGWNTGYNRWGQSAAAKGFFVFMPNYRAGSGRGNEFTMMGFADAGGREFDDILDGIEYLTDKGFIDKEKVGIGGGSYGGYFSAWAASKHTEHFAAAVSFVGIGNQLAKRNTTDIPWESYLVHWGYWVNEDPMAVYDRSPVRYAENMNTPILILHGTKDPRVHPSQSLEMYRAFKLRGKAPVRLVWYNGEGHGNSKNSNRLDYHLRTLDWFEYYLKGDGSKNKMPSYEINYNLDKLK